MTDDDEFSHHCDGIVLHRCDRCDAPVVVTVIIDTPDVLDTVRAVGAQVKMPTFAFLDHAEGKEAPAYTVYQVYPQPEVSFVASTVAFMELVELHKKRHTCTSRN